MAASPARKEGTVAQAIKVRQAPPLDYSFKEIRTMSDIVEEEPRSGKRKKRASVEEAATEQRHIKDQPTIVGSEGRLAGKLVIVQKPMTTSIKLDNNLLASWEGLDEALRAVMHHPMELAWLDLSHNELTGVDDVILKYKHLTALYLHANRITRLRDITKLAQLPKLKALTIHGNPAEEQAHARFRIISAIPTLRTLNFSPITPLDREKASTWRALRSRPRRDDATDASLSPARSPARG